MVTAPQVENKSNLVVQFRAAKVDICAVKEEASCEGTEHKLCKHFVLC